MCPGKPTSGEGSENSEGKLEETPPLNSQRRHHPFTSHPNPTQRGEGLCSLLLGSLPPYFLMSVSALAVPSLDLPTWDFLQHIHVTLRTLSSYLSEKLPLTKFPAGNFTDPKAIHDFDFYISQMDNQLLEGEHS